jgi:hypothetical protein
MLVSVILRVHHIQIIQAFFQSYPFETQTDFGVLGLLGIFEHFRSRELPYL